MGLASALVMGMVANQMKPMLQQQLQGGSQNHSQQQQQQQQQQQYYGAAAGGAGAGYGAQQAYGAYQGHQQQPSYGAQPNTYNSQYNPPQQGYGGLINPTPESHGGYHPGYINQQSPPPQQYGAPSPMPFPGSANAGGMPMPGGGMPMLGGGGGMPMPGGGAGGYQEQRGDHHYGAYAAGAVGLAAAGYGAYAYNQHHQHQQQAGAMGYGGGGLIDYNRILQVLQRGVQDQNLYAFYPQGSLEPLAQRIAQSNALPQIASAWNVAPEIVVDLARLALFDIVLYIDDSGSMVLDEGGERITDLQLVAKRVTSAACLLDTDGLQIRFMHSRGEQINSPQAVEDLIRRTTFNGGTPLGTQLQKQVLGPLVVDPARQGVLRKPVLVVILTDGEPMTEPRDTLVRVLKQTDAELRSTRFGSDAVSYQLAQIGNDEEAYRFLNEIDQGEVGKLIDVTSNYEREAENCRNAQPPYALTPDGWCLKLLLGGIDSTFDARDERKSHYGW